MPWSFLSICVDAYGGGVGWLVRLDRNPLFTVLSIGDQNVIEDNMIIAKP
jgi:hypothetical protein